MKKKLLYTALGLMGIMETLSMGIVNATTTVTPGTDGTISTLTVCGTEYISDSNGAEGCITIMDRNLGATSNDITSSDSYGNYYQRGNNYGFSSNPNATITTGNQQIDCSTYNPLNPFSSSTFIIDPNRHFSDYCSSSNDNLWGGGDDDSSYYSTNSYPVENESNRRGPCPKNYHVPSIGEWRALMDMWAGESVNGYYQGAEVLAFQSDFKIPFAGCRDAWSDSVYGQGEYLQLWSSSPHVGYGDAWPLKIDGDILAAEDYEWARTYGLPVRCFKNSITEPLQTFTLTFTASEENGSTSSSTGVVEEDTVIALSTGDYTATKEGWIHIGWNENPAATGAQASITMDSDKTVYAIFKKDLTATYLSGVGISSIDADSGSCTLYNTGTSCTVVAPDIILKAGYGTGIWSTGVIEVNPGETITLTADDTYTASATPNTDTQYLVEYYQEDLNGGYKLYETWTGHGTTDTQAVATGTDKSYSGFIFSGTHASNVTSGNIDGDGSRELKLYYDRMEYTVIFDSNSGSTVNPITAKYGSGITLPEPTRTGYTFKGWGDTFLSGNYTVTGNITLIGQWKANTYTVKFNAGDGTGTMEDQTFTYDVAQALTGNTFTRDGYTFSGWTDGTNVYTDKQSVKNLTGTSGAVVNLTAQWKQNTPSGGSSSGGGGGGGGGGSKTVKTNTGTTITTGTTVDTGSKVDSSATPQNDDSVSSGANTKDSENNKSTTVSEGKTYSEEFQKAYTFAHENKITTRNTIEEADMDKPLTRIAMAKMLSYYAINVLNKEPDKNRKIKFRDVSEKLDAQYDHGVTLAYQLGIMGINMKNNRFRPYDLVTRAEFATALSRLLFDTPDGEDIYYSTHLEKLLEEKIITNADPRLQELRGYVMIMLMRSAE